MCCSRMIWPGNIRELQNVIERCDRPFCPDRCCVPIDGVAEYDEAQPTALSAQTLAEARRVSISSKFWIKLVG